MPAALNRPELATAAELFAKACHASRLHDIAARCALIRYGDHGPAISGCVRDHFPDAVKDRLRELARAVTRYSEAGYAARPPRIRFDTMRQLARSVATRDGSGFYGPQPLRA